MSKVKNFISSELPVKVILQKLVNEFLSMILGLYVTQNMTC